MKIKSLLACLTCVSFSQTIISNPYPDNISQTHEIAFEQLKQLVDRAMPTHENEFNRGWTQFERIYALDQINWNFQRLAMYFDYSVHDLISDIQENKELFPEYGRFSVFGMQTLKFDNIKAKNIARKIEYIQTSACLQSTLIKTYEEGIWEE